MENCLQKNGRRWGPARGRTRLADGISAATDGGDRGARKAWDRFMSRAAVDVAVPVALAHFGGREGWLCYAFNAINAYILVTAPYVRGKRTVPTLYPRCREA